MDSTDDLLRKLEPILKDKTKANNYKNAECENGVRLIGLLYSAF